MSGLIIAGLVLVIIIMAYMWHEDRQMLAATEIPLEKLKRLEEEQKLRSRKKRK